MQAAAQAAPSGLPIDLIERAHVPQDLACRIGLDSFDRIHAWVDCDDDTASVSIQQRAASIRADLKADQCRDLALFLLMAADELEARNA